jgi:hypothetical protein
MKPPSVIALGLLLSSAGPAPISNRGIVITRNQWQAGQIAVMGVAAGVLSFLEPRAWPVLIVWAIVLAMFVGSLHAGAAGRGSPPGRAALKPVAGLDEPSSQSGDR